MITIVRAEGDSNLQSSMHLAKFLVLRRFAVDVKRAFSAVCFFVYSYSDFFSLTYIMILNDILILTL